MQTVAVRIHGHDRHEIVHVEFPHGFGDAEIEQAHAQHLVDGARVILRRAADAVEINRAVFLQRRQGLLAHAALAHHRTHAEVLDDVGLIRLLAAAGGGAGGLDGPLLAAFEHHGTAVIQQRAAQIDAFGQRILHQVRVHRVASGVALAGDQHHVAHFERADLLLADGRAQNDLASGEREALALHHFSTGRDGSRYSHSVMAPLSASSFTPKRR